MKKKADQKAKGLIFLVFSPHHKNKGAIRKPRECACGSTHEIKLVSGEKICKRCRDLHENSDYHRYQHAHHESIIEPFIVHYVKIKDL